MALEITGRIAQMLDLQSGTSAKGDWKKQEFILETEEQYPRKICISLWGERINDIADVQVGKDLITVSITLESREYNGRWYTDVRAWRIQRGPGVSTQSAAPSVGPVPMPAAPDTSPWTDTAPRDGDVDDLPF